MVPPTIFQWLARSVRDEAQTYGFPFGNNLCDVYCNGSVVIEVAVEIHPVARKKQLDLVVDIRIVYKN